MSGNAFRLSRVQQALLHAHEDREQGNGPSSLDLLCSGEKLVLLPWANKRVDTRDCYSSISWALEHDTKELSLELPNEDTGYSLNTPWHSTVYIH